MLDYTYTITLSRQDAVTWKTNIIYKNISADAQINEDKKLANGKSSSFSEMADYFIFIQKKYKDIQTWDLIEFFDDFWQKITLRVQSKDFINFTNFEQYIEIFCKLI